MSQRPLYNGEVVRVHSANCIEADLILGFDVKVTKRIILDGVFLDAMTDDYKSACHHCLVICVGGKRVAVEITSNPDSDLITAIVYLTERVKGPAGPLINIAGHDKPALEVNTFLKGFARVGYSRDELKKALNG